MSDKEQITWHSKELYPRAGFGHLDAQREHAIDRARQKLLGVRGNAAFLLHDRGANPQHVMEYVRRHALQTEDEARKAFDFISHPLFRSYTFTYYYGGAMLENLLVDGDNRDARFTCLLTEPVTPSQIRLWKDK
jgi:hypothetical protein